MNDSVQISTLRQSTLLWKQTFTLTLVDITREWTSRGGGNTGRQSVSLDGMRPKLAHQSTFAQDAKGPTVKGLVLLLLALSVYFSSFNKDIPLLAPVLAIIATPFLIAAVVRFRQRDWTILENLKGEGVFFIPHQGTQEEERQRFEALLVKTLSELQPKNEGPNNPAHT